MVFPALLPLMCTPQVPLVGWTDSPCRFKWTRPFCRKTSGFCTCAIAFQMHSTHISAKRIDTTVISVWHVRVLSALTGQFVHYIMWSVMCFSFCSTAHIQLLGQQTAWRLGETEENSRTSWYATLLGVSYCMFQTCRRHWIFLEGRFSC